jgi:WD40 repeat protein
LVSGGGDTTVRLWDVKTHKQVGDPLMGHSEQVISVAWRPDGNSFASASNDGTLRVWPASADPAEMCAKLTANMSHKQWNEWVSPDIGYKKVCPDLPVAPD